jgi:signal peptidase I
MKKWLLLLITSVISFLIFTTFIILPIRTFVINRVKVSGCCMYPTVDVSGKVWINKTAYWFNSPKRGDIISFKKQDMEQSYIKRVIGLPGETIDIYNCTVYIDGTALDEPYIWLPTFDDYGPVEVPENHVFVMGDNRDNSEDSRNGNIGMIPIKDIRGRVLLASR